MHSIFLQKISVPCTKKGVKVYTYLNVGSIENFRDYYKKYEYLTIGTYENWEEEKVGRCFE